MMKKALILVIDGCAPEYLTEQTAPKLFRLAEAHGFVKTVEAAVPTVTNVNHACILSGGFPETTQVVGNYYYDPVTKAEGFIEEAGFMKAETILSAYKRDGRSTAFLTVKGKVLGVYGKDVDFGVSVQTPDRKLIERLGLPMPPPVHDPAATEWIAQAALACVKRENPDFVYCTTNDFVFHHHGPETPEAQEQIRMLDDCIAEIHRADPERSIYITADHGMNRKTRLIDFQRIANRAGLDLHSLPPLKDRYIENHIYQEGGILYVFLNGKQQSEEFLAFTRSLPEVESVMTSREAAEEFHLPADRIGDYVIFAARECAFGELDSERLVTQSVRTHGSLHERTVPLLAIHPLASPEVYRNSKDIVAVMMARRHQQK